MYILAIAPWPWYQWQILNSCWTGIVCISIYLSKPTRLLAKQPELLQRQLTTLKNTLSHGQPLSLNPRRSVGPARIPGQTHKAAGRGRHFHFQPLSAAKPPHATRWSQSSEVICMASQEAPLRLSSWLLGLLSICNRFKDDTITRHYTLPCPTWGRRTRAVWEDAVCWLQLSFQHHSQYEDHPNALDPGTLHICL